MAEELENRRSSFFMADLLVLPSLMFRNPSYPADRALLTIVYTAHVKHCGPCV